MTTSKTAAPQLYPLAPKARPAALGPGYRYQGTSKSTSPAQKAEKVRKLLKQQRQLLSIKSSSFRDASVRMNERIAQAVRDGVKVTVLADIAQLPRNDVRRIALSFEDLDPTGIPYKDHLRKITELRAEYAAIEKARSAVEKKRLQVIAAARKDQLMDDYELASLTGLNPAYLGKMAWGVSPKRVFPA